MEYIATALVGAIVGFLLGNSSARASMRGKLGEYALQWSNDRARYLSVLRRELANAIMQRDPDRLERAYSKLSDSFRKFREFSKSQQLATRTAIAAEFPDYADFDLLGTREHVLYDDAASMFDTDTLIERFEVIAKFHALSKLVDESWRDAPPDYSSEVQHLSKYVVRLRDGHFARRMRNAMQLYFVALRATAKHNPQAASLMSFETEDFSVHFVSHIAESRYGVRFKDTGECGLYARYEQMTGRLYRSDECFETTIHLDPLPPETSRCELPD